MLSREQLEKLSLEDLQATAREFGIKPIGSYGKKEVWVNAMAQQRPPEAIALLNVYLVITILDYYTGECKDTKWVL